MGGKGVQKYGLIVTFNALAVILSFATSGILRLLLLLHSIESHQRRNASDELTNAALTRVSCWLTTMKINSPHGLSELLCDSTARCSLYSKEFLRYEKKLKNEDYLMGKCVTSECIGY